ncbi:MAG: hypothetical protein IPH06_03525 [Alphaproteobacteria bacterium]|nr:hypothetical protein [Alphaproteobacteria bacterium]QQS57109.1 MAG: hypothetical protein IPN28_12780 [Alphaproteobacteria bacterium]
MSEDAQQEVSGLATRDRSPAFPFISLKAAIERLGQLESKFGRHPTPIGKVGLAWDMKENSSQAGQTIAALKYFGLVDYEGAGKDRKAVITEDGRNYLRAQQDEIKKKILKKAALSPKEIAKFWALWGTDRPHEAVCLDQLVIDYKYNEKSARQFIKVYDDTIAFSGLAFSDKVVPIDENNGESEDGNKTKTNQSDSDEKPPLSPPPSSKGKTLMAGERVLQDGILSQNATYRIIVSGKIGPKEIDRLIKKLEVDKEILAEPAEDDDFSDIA